MSGADCLFCRIIAGEIPSNKVYEDDLAFAFRDTPFWVHGVSAGLEYRW